MKKPDLLDRFPGQTFFSSDLFENVGEALSFTQAKLQLVRKKAGARGPGASELEEGKLYTKKSIILDEVSEWTYSESKILSLLKDHPNVITLRGLVKPTFEQIKADK